jgi:signal transduction histidine kinase
VRIPVPLARSILNRMRDGRRWQLPSTLLVDGLLAAALLVVMVVGTSHLGQFPPDVVNARRPPDRTAYALMTAISVAMVARRLKPVPVLAVVVAGTSAYLLLQFPYGPIFFASSLALYTVGRELPARRALLTCLGAIAVILGVQLIGVPPSQLPAFAAHLVPWQSWLLVPWGPVGAALRTYREAARRDREDEGARLAFEERLRVAREVHDIVGHGLAVINMQAGVALHVLDRRPEQTREALEAIKQTSKDSLEELRGTLAVFRQRDDTAARRPVPGLSQLDAVATAMKESGLPVEVVVAGERREVPAVVDLAAYRIVQESLTNVLRHAGPTTATVSVTYEQRQVVVEVVDRGRARPGAAVNSGNGLPGMRERVAAVGGTLEAGPRAAGGFRVLARLPLGAQST